MARAAGDERRRMDTLAGGSPRVAESGGLGSLAPRTAALGPAFRTARLNRFPPILAGHEPPLRRPTLIFVRRATTTASYHRHRQLSLSGLAGTCVQKPRRLRQG